MCFFENACSYTEGRLRLDKCIRYSQPFNLHPETGFWGWHLRFFQVATLIFFLIYVTYKLSFFFRKKKSGFAEPEIFLGFETDPNFWNLKSGCRLKGWVCEKLKKENPSFLCLPRRFFQIYKVLCKTNIQIIGPTTNVFLKIPNYLSNE